jgi:D-3-phosphoglycerate dehydrogenase
VASGISLGSIGKIEVEFRGGVAANDTRLLGVAVLAGVLSGHTVEAVNLVNAPQMAEDRGIEISETNSSESGDFTDLIRVTIGSGDEMVSVGGTTVGPRQIPHLVSLWDEDFYLPFEPHMAVLRYSDRPGMIGTVGTVFGDAGVNIGSAAVGAESDGERAVMVVTADAPLGEETISGITALDGFIAGYALEL